MKRHLFLLTLCLCLLAPVALDAQEVESDLFWWNDRVFYEIFVRSFYDSDGDGVGDLRGVIEKLDYLNDGDPSTTADLGVTGLWLMPVSLSPSYHGYDVTDYNQINTDYGTNADFRALIEEAHARGIAVIVDLVVNHTSAQHPWFIASANGVPSYRDWYVWEEEAPNFRGPSGQPVWHRRGDGYYYAVFWDQMPDLNYENPEVTAAMEDTARFWLEDMGVDGFRVDGLKHIIEDGSVQENTDATRAWARDFNSFLDSVSAESLMVGEVWRTSYLWSQYVEEGGADLVFEFDLANAIVLSASAGTKNAIQSIQNRTVDLYPRGQYGTFLTNHDQNRVMTQLRGDTGAARVAASLLLTLPGVPFLYYGEEIGMVGQKPDERIRTPMQWDDTPETAGFTSADEPWQQLQNDHAEVNVAAQTGDPDSLLTHYRALINLRNDSVALRQGDFVPVESDSRAVYSFLRHHADQTVLVIINMSDDPVSEYVLTVEDGALHDVTRAASLFGDGEIEPPSINAGGGFDAYTPLAELPARSTTVIALQP